MSNQIVISSGAKVRSLEGVLTGTAGIVNSVPLGGANGVATLDALGKVPLSQLPASVVTYLGTWNAATNTPTLTNGVGDVGDLYICNVAGTVNFGAGPITFAVGDWVIYSGTEWQKSSGASGTVTSVAVTESGDALTITGSPITTSGTINIGFAGTGSQYIKGDGTLATFPTTIDQAKRLITEVYNSTGATLSKGTVVYINGGQGNLPTVTKAQANADNTSAQTYGVVQSDITNNNNGFVVVIGSLTDIDTQAYAVGTQLYLSGTTAGDWTSTKPSAPIHLVYVGIVVRSHPTQGVVEIRIQNGYELEELHDVAISAPVNNQGIFYNSSNDLWENKSIATALGYTPANDALVVHLAGTETIAGQKTFNATLFGTDAEFSGSILSPIVAILDNTTYTKVVRLQTTAATNRDVYFPDLNGTVALLEGTQTFSGSKTFSTAIKADSSILLKNGIQSILSGYVNIAGNTFGKGIDISYYDTAGTSPLTQVLNFSPTTSYTYTFPSASGTIALTSNLSSYVPYTGATGNVNLGSNNLTASNLFGETSLNVKILASGSAYSTGYSTFSTLAGKLTLAQEATAGNLKAFTFDFSAWATNSSYTYTLPSASGTLALTSNLSSYVPYTGATADVNLGTTYSLSANNITAAGVVKSDFGLQLKSGLTTTISGYLSISAQKVSTNSQLNVYTDTGFYFSLIAPNTANYSYTYPASSGTLVLGTGTTNYLPKFTGASTIGNSQIQDDGTSVGIGGSPNASYKLAVTGAGLYTGNLNINGETLTIGGTTNNAIINNIASVRVNIDCDNTGTGESFTIGHNQTAINDSNVLFRVQDNGNVGIGTSSPLQTNTNRTVTTINGTNDAILNLATGGTLRGYIYVDSSSYTELYSVGQLALLSNASQPMTFATNGSERMRITSGGIIEVRNGSTVGGEIKLTGGDNDMTINGVRGQLAIQINGSEEYGFDGLQFYPAPDNANALGASGNRWTVVYATTGTINTSDINEKEQIEDLDKIEKSVALIIKSKIKKYKWKDAVIKKGEDARIHIGAMAQEVEQSFIDAGLNPDKYGMFCSDTWWELDGKRVKEFQEGAIERTRKGLRYDEMLAFIISSL